ncbi:MAG: DNA polymerase III subunit delta [Sphingomonadaceae bacterium]
MLLKRQAFLGAFAQPAGDVRLWCVFGPDPGEAGALAEAARKGLKTEDGEVLELPASAVETEPGRLADEAASIPMFGGARLIIVAGVTERAGEAVRLLLDAPAAGNPVLALAGDLPRTSALRTLVERHPAARAVIAWAPTERDGARQAADLARAQGLLLAPGQAEALWQASGAHAGVLAREVEKLAIAAGATAQQPGQLPPDLFAQLVADSEGEDVNRLVAAILAGDHKALARAMASGDGVFPGLRALARRLFLLLELSAAMTRDGLDADAAVERHRPPVFWRDRPLLKAALPRWPPARIMEALDALLAAERAMKTPRAAGEVLAAHALLLAAGRNPLGAPRRAA